MIDVYIDRTTGKKSIIKANYCYYCDKDCYPNGRFLDINDKHAQRTEKGDWKCGDCITDDKVKMMIRTVGPMDPYVKRYIDEEQRKVDIWNAGAKTANTEERKRGGTKDIMKPKKNKYWSNW